MKSAQKWNVGPEHRKERETFCGRLRKRTPFLRLRTQLHRIRGRTLRTESLDRSNARDLVQVVRLLREVDVSPVSPSSTTTGCEGEWSAFDPLPKLTQASDKDVRIIVGKERESYEPELNYTGCEGERSGLKHWTRITQRAACSRADICRSGRRFCLFELNY